VTVTLLILASSAARRTAGKPVSLCAWLSCQRLCLHVLQGVGYGISIAAFFWYQRIKMQQISAESRVISVAASAGGGDKAGVETLPRYHAVPVNDLIEGKKVQQ
jgi:hypothetical protein